MTLLVAADVVGRYVFQNPLTGSTDLIELMLVFLVFFGLAYCAAVDGHVSVDVVYSRLPRRVQRNLDKITSAASVIIFALMAWRMGLRAWDNAQDPEGFVTSMLLIPHWPFMFLAALGALLLFVQLIINFIHSLTRVR